MFTKYIHDYSYDKALIDITVGGIALMMTYHISSQNNNTDPHHTLGRLEVG